MCEIQVDSLKFKFPDTWKVQKYDDWKFYHLFKGMQKGIKGVDLIAINSNNQIWLIEAKDFRKYRRTKKTPLHEEIWGKVYNTLAALFPAKLYADIEEAKFAKQVLAGKSLRIAVQCEQPKQHSKLFPQSVDIAKLQKKLRELLKPIDPHVLVINRHKMAPATPWTVQ